MKKLFTTLCIALLSLCATSCNTDTNIEINPIAGETLTFVASIDNTRTDLDGLQTVWCEGDIVTIDTYNFVCGADCATFICSAEGVSDLLGREVRAIYSYRGEGVINSTAGTAGALLEATGTLEDGGSLKFQIKSAFMKFSAAPNSDFALSVGSTTVTSSELTPKEGFYYVAVEPSEEPVSVSYSYDGQMQKQTTMTITAGKIYNLGEFVKLPRVYVCQIDNSWTTLNLYSWGADNSTLTGSWPGTTTDVTTTIGDYTYRVWTMPAAAIDTTIMVIINDGSSQTGDSGPYSLGEELYLLLYENTLYLVEDPTNPEAALPTESYRIYLYQYNNSWTTLNLWAWNRDNSSTNYTGGTWPGIAAEGTATVGNYTYSYWTMPASATGQDLSVLVNNGESQTGDLNIGTLDSDCYLLLNGSTLSIVDDHLNPEPVINEYPEKLYLMPSEEWLSDGAWFAAYLYGNGDTWVSMSDTDSNGIFECTLPTDKQYTNIIFCRMNPASSEPGWDSKWSQTANLDIYWDGTNLYTISGWDKGSWSKFTPAN